MIIMKVFSLAFLLCVYCAAPPKHEVAALSESRVTFKLTAGETDTTLRRFAALGPTISVAAYKSSKGCDRAEMFAAFCQMYTFMDTLSALTTIAFKPPLYTHRHAASLLVSAISLLILSCVESSDYGRMINMVCLIHK